MRQHYTPPWRWADAARAVVLTLMLAAIGVMLAHGCVPID